MTRRPPARYSELLVAPLEATDPWIVRAWLLAALLFAVVMAIPSLWIAVSREYAVQGDARQNLFWMERFVDPELFPDDYIAGYFEATSPPGVTATYWVAAHIGVDPHTLHLILPVILGVIATAFCFLLALRLFPFPSAAFLACLLLNQSFWTKDDLISATSRAFIYPLLIAFLYFLVRRSLWMCLLLIALQGLFYPQYLPILCGIFVLRLWVWDWRSRLIPPRRELLFCVAAAAIAGAIVLAFLLQASEFGPIVSAAEARTQPEFGPGGRVEYFVSDPIQFWLGSRRSGLLPAEWVESAPLVAPQVLLAPILLLMLARPARFPLLARLGVERSILVQPLIVGLGMYAAAHLLLFRLYLPNRYTSFSLRIVFALAAGIVLIVLLDALRCWLARRYPAARPPAWILPAVAAAIGLGLLAYPLLLRASGGAFPLQYAIGSEPELYRFLESQPKDALIASLDAEANDIPSFAHRSVLIGREVSIPYYSGYYRVIRQRTIDLIQAQYSADLDEVQGFIRTYGVDLWLIDRDSLTLAFAEQNERIKQLEPQTGTLSRLRAGAFPVLPTLVERCSVFTQDEMIVLSADCILSS